MKKEDRQIEWEKGLKNALPLEKRTCFNCRFVNVISEDLGEVYCKKFSDSPQGIYRNAIIKMDSKGKCRFWEYKEESEEK